MNTFVFLVVMGAALLHATWNALIKTGGDKLTAMLMMTIIEGALGAMTRNLPQGAVGGVDRGRGYADAALAGMIS